MFVIILIIFYSTDSDGTQFDGGCMCFASF